MAKLSEADCRKVVKDLIDSGKLPHELESVESYTKSSRKTFLERLCEGAVKGREAEDFGSISEWAEDLAFSSVFLTRDDYLAACIHALRLAPRIAATDYGTSRQRDLAQVWTDAIRGLLGEIAFAKWMKERFGIEIELDFRLGSLEEFLPSDVVGISKPGEGRRKPRLRISIKTTKLQGIWLDIPYAQIEHSDVFILVRVGVSRSHFLAFLKDISVIRDKIFELAEKQGIKFSKDEIWGSIPDFTGVPAFIVGFFDKSRWTERIEDRRSILLADGDLKRTRGENFKIVLNKFAGWWNPKEPEYKRRLAEIVKCKHPEISLHPERLTVEFEGLGEPSETLHFLVSSGALNRKREDWSHLVGRL